MSPVSLSSNEDSTTLVIAGHHDDESVIDTIPFLSISKQHYSSNCDAEGAINIPTLPPFSAEDNSFKKSLSFHEVIK